MKLSEIREKVSREEWVLPPFQRDFVWNEERKIIEFIESVFNEWPIGSVIIWVPDPKDEDVIKKRKLQTKSEGKPQHLVEYIIDGQQRITTLLRVLNNEPFVFRGKEKKLCYDFESDEFSFYETNDHLPRNVLFLFEIINRKHSETRKELNLGVIQAKNLIFTELARMEWFSEEEIFEIWEKKGIGVDSYANELRKMLNRLVSRERLERNSSNLYRRISELPMELRDVDDVIDKIKKIKDYSVVIQRPNMAISLKDAQELFIRLNTGGKQLPSVDLALAYISLLWDDSREEFKLFKEKLEPTGFYFDVDFFVRCLSAISLNQSLTKKLIRSFKPEKIKEDWEITKSGIEKTIDFLKTALNLGSNLFLEAENTLVPIVLLFSKKEDKVRNKMGLLAYWFLVSYINQRFSGQSTAILNKDIKTILESDDPVDGLINNLKEDKLFFKLKPEDIKGYQFKFILYCLFRKLGTKDFITGFGIDSISASKANRLDFHHIFADAILKRSKFKYLKEDIANKTFLTNRSNKKLSSSDPTYLSEYPKKLLRAHLIPVNESLWKLEKYEEFLQERKKIISRELNKFLNELKESQF